MELEDDMNLDDEFEYHDGLGDLLREKERQEFSWLKTIIVLVSVLTVFTLFIMLVFKVGKSLMVRTPERIGDLPKVTQDIDVIEKKQPEKIAELKPSYQEKKKVIKPKKELIVKKKTAVYPRKKQRLSTKSLYRVIVGSFLSIKQGQRMVRQLKKRKIDSYVWIYKTNSKTLYRVQVGAFQNLKSARELEAKMKKLGLDTYVLKQ